MGRDRGIPTLTSSALAHRPAVALLLLVAAIAYAVGWWRLSRRACSRVPWWRPILSVIGLGSLAVALLSPLDNLAHRRFAAHMVQHMLLIVVAAPALLAADPLVALLWALPARMRLWVGRRLVRGAPLRNMLWAVTRMPVAWITYAVVLWGWHVPAAYDSALADGLLHDVEHVAFFVSAVTFWWPVLDPAPHVGRSAHAGLRVIYLVTGALQSAALGLLLAGSPVPLYTSYIAREAEGLSALDDQALGGVVMWGVGGAVDMLVLLVLVYRFLAANAHDHRAAAPSRP